MLWTLLRARARAHTHTHTLLPWHPSHRLPQIYAQIKYFLPDPVANDVKYQASAQPFLVFGLLTTGLAIGAHNNAAAAAAQAAELVGGAAAYVGEVATAAAALL